MYSKVHRPKKNEQFVSENAGSCINVASYLNKEKGVGKFFFSHDEDQLTLTDVVDRIDNNKKTLKKNQDKFYMLSYNPSHREIQHLIMMTCRKKVNSFSELNKEEKTAVMNVFRNYIRKNMNIYASNFNRSKELTANDLVYFGRIEEERHYTFDDKVVKDGVKIKGDLKDGLNLHAHIIVSRMDLSQTIALSPLTKSRNCVNKLNGNEVKSGFDMMNWQIECMENFCDEFNYIAPDDECFYYKHSFRDRMQNRIVQEILEGMDEEKQLVRSISFLKKSPKQLIRSFIRLGVKEILNGCEAEI